MRQSPLVSGYPEINSNHNHYATPISDPNYNFISLPVSNTEHSHQMSGYLPKTYQPNWAFNPNILSTHQPSPVMGGCQPSKNYTKPKVHYNTVISNNYAPPQVQQYTELYPLNNND